MVSPSFPMWDMRFQIADLGFRISDCRLKHGNYKSQNSNNKQITMTEIVRASLGLPTLLAGPQFQNFKPHIILIRENPKYVWVFDYWNLRFICNLVLGIWNLV
jgi:hypothetical protein